jgi:hypothetical protein
MTYYATLRYLMKDQLVAASIKNIIMEIEYVTQRLKDDEDKNKKFSYLERIIAYIETLIEIELDRSSPIITSE